MKASFKQALALMHRHNPQSAEDGFQLLLPHVDEHLDDLIAEYRKESNHGLKCWLLELIGNAHDPRIVELLAVELGSADEAIRGWALRGLESFAGRKYSRGQRPATQSEHLRSPNHAAPFASSPARSFRTREHREATPSRDAEADRLRTSTTRCSRLAGGTADAAGSHVLRLAER